MTIGNYEKFEKAERIEELAAELYACLMVRFRDVEDARQLFDRLRREELQHAMRVHMAFRRYLEHPERFHDVPVDTEALDHFIAQAERTLADLRDPSTRLTPHEARAVMVSLESIMASSHAETLASEADAQLRVFFESLASQDREHVALLRRSQPTTRPPGALAQPAGTS